MKKLILLLLLIPQISLASVSGDLINAYRVENGLSVAKENKATCLFAKKRLKEVKKDWSHDGFYLSVDRSVGVWHENLARNFSTDKKAVEGWIQSESHRKNLLSDMTSMCVKKSGKYWVMIGLKN